ncbi:MAG: DUF5666 domain-containing protein [Candidatus Berkelbacteria bacterium]|nr:DUF5666 domain-containing protein [Candidatus Berkelbacteria bacterium]
MKIKKIIVPVVVAVVFAAGGFFGGIQYQKSKTPSRQNGFPSDFPGATGMRAGGATGQGRTGGAGRGGFTAGDVISKDDKSITVKNTDGSTKIVYFSDSTTVTKNETGSKDDVAVGKKVSVMGTANSDGSVAATNIQIQP